MAYELTNRSVNCIWLFLVSVATQMDFFVLFCFVLFWHSVPHLQKGAPWVCEDMCLERVGRAGWGNVWHAQELKFHFYALKKKKKKKPLEDLGGCQFPMEETPLTLCSYKQNLKGKRCVSSLPIHWGQID